MQRKLVSFVLAIAFLTPALAAADSIPGEPTLGQLLSRLAFLRAQEQGMQIACSIASSKQNPKVGEAYVVAWGSYGAYDTSISGESRWAPNGMETIIVQKPGTYQYKFSFAGPGGVATCLSYVTVSAN